MGYIITLTRAEDGRTTFFRNPASTTAKRARATVFEDRNTADRFARALRNSNLARGAEVKVTPADADMQWEDISTAPRDGKPVLVETSDGYLVSAVYWTLDMLREAEPLTSFKSGDEYWSHNDQDMCCKPVRWLKGFPMPRHITVELH